MNASDIKKVVCVSAGVIGSSWACRYAMGGCETVVYDIDGAAIENARRNIRGNLDSIASYGYMTEERMNAILSRISYTTSIEEAVKNAKFIQESGPENYDIKRSILAQVDRYAPADAIYASSTSGLLITRIAGDSKHPERCLGAHPFNPPHLMPLIELSTVNCMDCEAIDVAKDFFENVGMEPVRILKEVPGFIANRMQFAMYREGIDLVMRGVCTVEDMDRAATYGIGLRLAAMGLNLLFQIGGGAGGIAGLIHHLNPMASELTPTLATWPITPEEWPDIAQAGVNAQLSKRRPETGNDNATLKSYRDKILLGVLHLHDRI